MGRLQGDEFFTRIRTPNRVRERMSVTVGPSKGHRYKPGEGPQRVFMRVSASCPYVPTPCPHRPPPPPPTPSHKPAPASTVIVRLVAYISPPPAPPPPPQVGSRVKTQLEAALDVTGGGRDVWKAFWATQQRFFKLLCVSLKVGPNKPHPPSLPATSVPVCLGLCILHPTLIDPI